MGGVCCCLKIICQNSENLTNDIENETIQIEITSEEIRNATDENISPNQTELVTTERKTGKLSKISVSASENHQNILTNEAENIRKDIQKPRKDDGKILQVIRPKTNEIDLQYKSLKDEINIPTWKCMLANEEVTYINLNQTDFECRQIEELFLNTTKRKFVNIISIHRVQNPYLMGRYSLKKMAMKRTFQGEPKEQCLFHGTKATFAHSICQNNLDWRKHGGSKGHCYGKGVNFSPISHYATYYCDKGDVQKVMLVAKVLICNPCVGNQNMTLPPLCGSESHIRYDASAKENGHVIVKYSDDEFYPAYKITFVVTNLNIYYKKKHRKQK